MPKTRCITLAVIPILAFCCVAALAQEAAQPVQGLTLAQAIEMALAHNLGLEGAMYQRQAARWGMYNSIANYLPAATFNTTYTRLDQETVDKANSGDDYISKIAEQLGIDLGKREPSAFEDNYSSNISVVQPIFNGGAEIAAIRAGRAASRQAAFAYDDAVLSTVRDTKIAYFTVMQAEALKQVSQDGLALANETLRTFQAQFEVGQVSRSEVLRWEAQVAQAEGAVIEAQSGYELAMMDLANILGVDLTNKYRLDPLGLDIDPQLYSAVRQELNRLQEPGAVNELIAHHPAYKSANEAVKIQSANYQLAWATVLPKLNFAYTYSWPADETIDLEGDQYWTASVQLQVPLFTGFRGVTSIVQERANLRKARVDVRDFERGFDQQVRAAVLQLDTAYRKLEAAKKQVAFAEENLRNVQGKMDVGMASNLELLDAQVTYNSARADLVGAVSDYYIALAAWEYIVAQTY